MVSILVWKEIFRGKEKMNINKNMHTNKSLQTYGQDGGVERHGTFLCTTTSTLQLKNRITITQIPQKLS